MAIKIPIKMNTVRSHRVIQFFLERSKNWNVENRDFSIYWSIAHMTTTAQIMRLFAISRGLNPDICAIAGAIHDVATMESGKTENHAVRSLEYIGPLLNEYNISKFAEGEKYILTDNELIILKELIPQHGDKGKVSDNPYVEALKDADAIDRYLHGVETKILEMPRLISVFSELGIYIEFDV